MFRVVGGLKDVILAGDCCRGISKKEGAFMDVSGARLASEKNGG